MQRVIFHIDMDAFFTSVEQRDNPEIKGKPVIVGAQPGHRGVVSAASYEARKFGVHSAMPINEAVRKCPQGVFLLPRMKVYSDVSSNIMSIFEDFSPAVEQISVDEAFLDITGTEKLFGNPEKAAHLISDRIRNEQHLTASIGIAPNKFLAKIASDLNKPNGITYCPFESDKIIEWLAPMKVGRIWGIGKKTALVFEGMGILLVRDLQNLPMKSLQSRFGKQGISLYNLCRGIDDRPVESSEKAKSISREFTFEVDSRDREQWKKALFLLAQDVSRRARKAGVKGSTIVLTYRRPDFSRHSKRKPFPFPTNIAKFIYENVIDLLDSTHEGALRLIGVGITGLCEEIQTDLFESESRSENWEASEKAVDNLVERFGKGVVRKGQEIGLKNGSAKNGKHLKDNNEGRHLL